MFVKPGTVGLVVRDPHTLAAMPAEGRDVPEIQYWLRRLRDGDVVRAEPPAADAQRQGSDAA